MRHTGVDGLRGLAALVVLSFHTWNQINDGTLIAPNVVVEAINLVNATPVGVLSAGPLAVHLFFLLSGFALFTGYRSGGKSAGTFYLARLARLYIPVWPALGLAILVASIGSSNPNLVSLSTIFNEPFGILKSLTLVFGVGVALPALWSLTWEVWFSIAVPLLRRVTGWKVNFWAAFIGLTGAMVLGDLFKIGALRYGPMFLFGVLISLKWDVISRVFQMLRGGAAGLFIVGVMTPATLLMLPTMLAHWIPDYLTTDLISPFYYPIEFLAFLMLIGVTTVRRLTGTPFLDSKWVQYSGRISFSLYLTHQSVLAAIARLPWNSLAILALDFILAIALAVVFYNAIESRSHKLARSLSRQVGWHEKP